MTVRQLAEILSALPEEDKDYEVVHIDIEGRIWKLNGEPYYKNIFSVLEEGEKK